MTQRHFTSSANPGPPRDPQPKPAPPPPPKIRWWLLLVGVLATILLLSLPGMKTKPTVSLNYSSFFSRVEANKIVTASINQDGGVSGKFKTGTATQADPDRSDDPPAHLDLERPRRLRDGGEA